MITVPVWALIVAAVVCVVLGWFFNELWQDVVDATGGLGDMLWNVLAVIGLIAVIWGITAAAT